MLYWQRCWGRLGRCTRSQRCRYRRRPVLPQQAPLGAVPVVLDGIVCASRQPLGDLCPAVAKVLVSACQDGLLLRAPGLLINAGVQLIVPPERARGTKSGSVRTRTQTEAKTLGVPCHCKRGAARHAPPLLTVRGTACRCAQGGGSQ